VWIISYGEGVIVPKKFSLEAVGICGNTNNNDYSGSKPNISSVSIDGWGPMFGSSSTGSRMSNFLCWRK